MICGVVLVKSVEIVFTLKQFCFSFLDETAVWGLCGIKHIFWFHVGMEIGNSGLSDKLLLIPALCFLSLATSKFFSYFSVCYKQQCPLDI